MTAALQRKLKIIETGDVYMADPPIEDGLRAAFRELASAEHAKAEAEAEVKRLCRALAKERGVAFIRLETARRELLG